jgi:tRNA A-37 threonylcarbamoyl transferase component Bud32
MSMMHNIGDVILNRYQVMDFSGEGGQSCIMKGIDLQTGHSVAIKQMLVRMHDVDYKQALARFHREGKLRIQHKNVVDPIDSGTENGENYIITPFIENSSNLWQWLQTNRDTVNMNLVESLFRQILEGLESIHAKNVIHRDIKPENCLIALNLMLYIIDLGLARILTEHTITRKVNILGSVYWMSPEQIEDPTQVDARSDLYSTGAVFYLMLTKTCPAQGTDTKSVIVNILNTMPPSPRQVNSQVPAHLDQICMKLLAKLPSQRFQSAQEVLAALHQYPSVLTSPQNNCASCGTGLQLDYRFCPVCGAGLMQTQAIAKCIACGYPVGQANQCNQCHRLFGPVPHRFYFISGALTGETFRIPEGNFIVGRNELAPRDYRISRRHFSLSCQNGTVFMQDQGSANKTWIGCQPADLPILLQHQIQIVIAGSTAIYLNS